MPDGPSTAVCSRSEEEAVRRLFAGDGEVEELARQLDWAATPLGPVSGWPPLLRSIVRLALETPWPVTVFWGPEAITLHNNAGAATIGRLGEVYARSHYESYPEVQGYTRPLFARVMAGESVAETGKLVPFRRDDKIEDAWFDFSYTPIREADGTIVGVFQVWRERTAEVLASGRQVEAREALRKTEERLRALVRASSNAVYTMSPDWREMRDLQGNDFIPDTDSPTGTWLEKYIDPGDQPHVLSVIDEAVRTKGVFELEHRVRRVDGSLGWTLSRAVPLLDEEGEIREWVGMAFDITERRLALQALRLANRQKGRFLAVLSHELRNPLAAIGNGLAVLDRVEPGSDQARRTRTIIDRQFEHVRRLVDDLLDLTRISANKVILKRQGLDLCDLVRQVADDFRPFFERHGVGLDLDLASEPVPVDGDGARLAQVVGNLLSNAAKFSQAGGRVRVSVAAQPESRTVVVRVVDAGAGIPPGMLSSIFEPFTQVGKGLARENGGLGLGLSLVKGLVELHGGQVTAISEGEGRGAEFVVILPLETREAGEVTGERAGERLAPSAEARRVLVIEDNRDIAEVLGELLAIAGHEVATAYDGPGGLAQAAGFRPDVVLCDIGLPGMDGYEVARAFRADDRLKDTALVALSGYAQPDDVRKAREAGFDRHLAKPANLPAIEALLRDLKR